MSDTEEPTEEGYDDNEDRENETDESSLYTRVKRCVLLFQTHAFA